MPRIAEVKAQVERIWLATFQTALAETVTQQVRQHALAGVQAALETALVEELNAYRTHWDEQQPPCTCLPPALQRSGTYTLHVLTSYGCISALRVPKLRGGQSCAALANPHALPGGYARSAGAGPLSVHAGALHSRPPRSRVRPVWATALARRAESGDLGRPIADGGVVPATHHGHAPPILIVDGVWVQILAPMGARPGSTAAATRGAKCAGRTRWCWR